MTKPRRKAEIRAAALAAQPPAPLPPPRTWRDVFLRAVADGASVAAAARAAGVSRSAVYLQRNPGFEAAWREAADEARARVKFLPKRPHYRLPSRAIQRWNETLQRHEGAFSS